jgi:hypothetical protein
VGADNYHIVSDWRIRGTIDEVYEILPVYSADSTSSRSNEECRSMASPHYVHYATVRFRKLGLCAPIW